MREQGGCRGSDGVIPKRCFSKRHIIKLISVCLWGLLEVVLQLAVDLRLITPKCTIINSMLAMLCCRPLETMVGCWWSHDLFVSLWICGISLLWNST